MTDRGAMELQVKGFMSACKKASSDSGVDMMGFKVRTHIIDDDEDVLQAARLFLKQHVTSIDIISFDAFGFLDRLILYADNLKSFFKRGGILCWGIVPTQEFTGQETPSLLADKLNSGINSLVKKRYR
jgi:hypothetical protein